MTKTEALAKIKKYAVADAASSGILASLTGAQMILESGWLASGLTVKANNAFGIKGSYKGSYYDCKTKEYQNGKQVEIVARFKKYPSLSESVADHSALLSKARYKAVKAASDYKTACKAIAAAGYATAPNYANQLIQLIEQYKLYEWDAISSASGSSNASGSSGASGIKVGDKVEFVGGYHYASADSDTAVGGKRTAGAAKLTKIQVGAKHPYHLIGTGSCNVYGWVSEAQIRL